MPHAGVKAAMSDAFWASAASIIISVIGFVAAHRKAKAAAREASAAKAAADAVRDEAVAESKRVAEVESKRVTADGLASLGRRVKALEAERKP